MEEYKNEVKNIRRLIDKEGENRCVYCGANGDTQDHVIPLSYFSNNSSRSKSHAGKRYTSSGWFTLSSCRNCNCLAGNSCQSSFIERKHFILKKFEMKYIKRLKSKEWSVEELNELEYSLRETIRGYNDFNKFLKLRYENLKADLPII